MVPPSLRRAGGDSPGVPGAYGGRSTPAETGSEKGMGSSARDAFHTHRARSARPGSPRGFSLHQRSRQGPRGPPLSPAPPEPVAQLPGGGGQRAESSAVRAPGLTRHCQSRRGPRPRMGCGCVWPPRVFVCFHVWCQHCKIRKSFVKTQFAWENERAGIHEPGFCWSALRELDPSPGRKTLGPG